MSHRVYAPLSAILGPTNTGKTHLAVERMLGHSSGMMGFPLRLLAREVYDRVVALKGASAVALVTGEERIWPDTARYILATAEAMPIVGGRDVSFVALDEAQLGQDRERGHVFASRLLHARGRDETMILGSASLAPVVRALVPDAEITSRPRFSTLSYDGPRKLSRLPPRSAIVAFSAEEVYAIAEALRRFSGGAAVVMGALSPRTRNAQVAMFQAGEVDYLVATDAIGMGLNLDVRHVAFASLNKFDGVRQRRLYLSEMAQIAGRAGRHQRDGTFGSVGGEAAFTPEEIAALEEHRFTPIDWLYWRNPAPAFDSVAALIADLEQLPDQPMLRAAPDATDLGVLRRMADDAEAMALISGPDSVQRLWSACSLPDFRKSGIEPHGRLIARLWRELGQGKGTINADWFRAQIGALDKRQGAVEVLADRLAGVRTYCYMAQRADWLDDASAMAALAAECEAGLSDALHDALTARFVDRRTTVLLRALGQDGSALPVAVDDGDGAVRVDGEVIGHLAGFRFAVDPAARAHDRRMLLAAAERHLSVELSRRGSALAADVDGAFTLVTTAGDAPAILWRGISVATLGKGRDRVNPRITLDRTIAELDPHIVAAIMARVERVIDSGIADRIGPIVRIAARARDPQASGHLRAILAALVDGSGVADRAALDQSLRQLQPPERAELQRLGVQVGSLDLFVRAVLKPEPLRWLAALHAAWTGTALPIVPDAAAGMLRVGSGDTAAIGFRRVGDVRIRVDLIENIARDAHRARVAAGQAATAGEAPHVAAPVVDTSVSGDGQPSGAATPTSARPRPAAFALPIDRARSLGLALPERVQLLRLLGFRPQGPLADGDPFADQSALWQWHGRRERTAQRKKRPPTAAAKGAKQSARPPVTAPRPSPPSANNPFVLALSGLITPDDPPAKRARKNGHRRRK
ncbi:MAG: helicase [Sphingopyxis sp.]|nr:helicase [Sphingopyxis sp.]